MYIDNKIIYIAYNIIARNSKKVGESSRKVGT